MKRLIILFLVLITASAYAQNTPSSPPAFWDRYYAKRWSDAIAIASNLKSLDEGVTRKIELYKIYSLAYLGFQGELSVDEVNTRLSEEVGKDVLVECHITNNAHEKGKFFVNIKELTATYSGKVDRSSIADTFGATLDVKCLLLAAQDTKRLENLPLDLYGVVKGVSISVSANGDKSIQLTLEKGNFQQNPDL